MKLQIVNTYFTQKELLDVMNKDTKSNYHIFINSMTSIKSVLKRLGDVPYRIVCSESLKAKNPKLNITSTKDRVGKYNFYTATAFEGCDIFDPIGKSIIVCDTNIATTILDISTLVRQICGRVRDSRYKDHVTIILNTDKHRYADITQEEFNSNVKANEKEGKHIE